jgi:hypothetical protein
MYSVLNYHNVARPSCIWDSYGSMWFSLVMQGVSRRALQGYSKCYCVASVTKTFILKGVQTIHRSTPWTDLECDCKILFFLNTLYIGAEIWPRRVVNTNQKCCYLSWLAQWKECWHCQTLDSFVSTWSYNRTCYRIVRAFPEIPFDLVSFLAQICPICSLFWATFPVCLFQYYCVFVLPYLKFRLISNSLQIAPID